MKLRKHKNIESIYKPQARSHKSRRGADLQVTVIKDVGLLAC